MLEVLINISIGVVFAMCLSWISDACHSHADRLQRSVDAYNTKDV
jgi:hypothetical protein